VVDDQSVICVDGLWKSFNGVRAVEDVSFAVQAGSIVGLLGPNGSGKSTTLHCLTGIVEPSGGGIWFDGLPRHDRRSKDAFGLVPDDLPLPGSLHGSELIALNRRLRPRFELGLANDLLDLVGLRHELARPVGDYSHGMKRKLQLVIALAHRPRVLILDEPFRGLDAEAAIVLRTIIDTFRLQGGAVVVATHDLLAAEHLCDEVVILAAGCVIASGAPDTLMRRSGTVSLEQLFVQVTGLVDRIADSGFAIRQLSLTGASPILTV